MQAPVLDSTDRFLSCNCFGLKIHTPEEDWIYDEEPHCHRRKQILKVHPEIKKLMGYDSNIARIVIIEVFVQLFTCYLIKDAPWTVIFVLAYCFGGVLNHSLGTAIHEIGHNLAYGHGQPARNQVLSLICNIPLIVPVAITYKKYHVDHHRFLGEETRDGDVPLRIELFLFRHPATRILWLIFNPIIHGIRPFLKHPKPVTRWEVLNTIIQVFVVVMLYQTFGEKSIIYLLSSTFLTFGLHPLAGHFISSHYVFTNTGQASTSYYGPLNKILFNVGYHVEHHDFPYIPYNKLPEVRRIAPEFYQQPHHTSWINVIWTFIFDKSNGPQARSCGYYRKRER